MRSALLSHPGQSFVRKCIIVLGSTIALSACNTTNDVQSLKTGQVSQADISAGDDGQVVTALADPVLPNTIPIPGIRGQSEPMMSYASAQLEASPASVAASMIFETPDHAPDGLDGLISKYAAAYAVPENLVRRVVHRESRFNPAARNGAYWGLMQISHPTARGMGYAGTAKGLLDAETNLKYAVRYLSGAYKVADGDESQAVRLYARGYYYDAKRKGLLRETGLDGSFRASSEE